MFFRGCKEALEKINGAELQASIGWDGPLRLLPEDFELEKRFLILVEESSEKVTRDIINNKKEKEKQDKKKEDTITESGRSDPSKLIKTLFKDCALAVHGCP